jgi:uncharacterized coiled-coil DUF342 family protein
MKNTIKDLKSKKEAICKEIEKAEKERKEDLFKNLSAEKFNDLKSKYTNLIENGITEKIKLTFEFEVEVSCKIDIDTMRDEAKVDNSVIVLKTNNKNVSDFIVDALQNDDFFSYPIVDPSKKAMDKFEIERDDLFAKIEEISETIGIEKEEFMDIIMNCKNLKQARKEIFNET